MNRNALKKAFSIAYISTSFLYEPAYSQSRLLDNYNQLKSFKSKDLIIKNKSSVNFILENENLYAIDNTKQFKKITDPIQLPKDVDIDKIFELIIADSSSDNTQNSNNNFIEVEILANQQYQSENGFKAFGDVSILSKKGLLIADEFEYIKDKNIFIAKGNVKYKRGELYIQSDEIKYNFETNEGYMIKPYGLIDFRSFANDLNLDDQNIRVISRKELLQEESINNARRITNNIYAIGNIKISNSDNIQASGPSIRLNTKGIDRWRFQSEKIVIKRNSWTSDRLSMTNDPYNKAQLRIENIKFKGEKKELEAAGKDAQIIISSNWSYFVFDDTLKVPMGPRKIRIKEDESMMRWGIGYDYKDKDGFFIMSDLNPIYFGKNDKYKLKFTPQFLMQRSILGTTNSFRKSDKSIMSATIEQDASFEDYFGLRSELTSSFQKWRFNLDTEFNSFDLNKFKQIFRSKSSLKRNIFRLKEKTTEREIDFSFFADYRDRTWNGSLGEKEIFTAYGIRLDYKDKALEKYLTKISNVGLVLGEYQAKPENNSPQIISENRLSFFASRNYRYNLSRSFRENYIDQSYKYSPLPKKSGLFFDVNPKLDIYRYSGGDGQEILTLRTGPQLILGEQKDKFFDYTDISIHPIVKFSNGTSPFSFDKSVDSKSIEFKFKQQLYGPLIAGYSTKLLLDPDSEKYNHLIQSIVNLSWNRRAYKAELFYNIDSEAGGIQFSMYGLDFIGSGKPFSPE